MRASTPGENLPGLKAANNLPGRYPVEDWRAYYWAVADDGSPHEQYVTVQLPTGYAGVCSPVEWGERGCIYVVRRWGLACLPSRLEAKAALTASAAAFKSWAMGPALSVVEGEVEGEVEGANWRTLF